MEMKEIVLSRLLIAYSQVMLQGWMLEQVTKHFITFPPDRFKANRLT
jgi:hypothetical protein